MCKKRGRRLLCAVGFKGAAGRLQWVGYMQEHLELWLAFVACLILAVFYAAYAILATPSGGHPFGLLMGAIGMALMVITETVYSIRKRVQWLHWLGSLRMWLSFHIFTGIVGPFLVLLHSAFAVGGLAGWAFAMAGIVVLSGFAGRYIYTAVPRTRAGIELGRDELIARAETLQMELDEWILNKPMLTSLLPAATTPAKTINWSDVLLRTWKDHAYDQHVHAALQTLTRTDGARVRELEQLLRKQHRLERQIASLDWVQRIMGLWRLAHIPLGITLFTTALIHIVAALYFRGLRF